MTTSSNNFDNDVFDVDFFQDDETEDYKTLGKWGKLILHILKAAFVLYSGGHNVNASLAAAGDNAFAMFAQIIGVLVLEATIVAIYLAGIGKRITGTFQALIAGLLWATGMTLASMGIIVDSRINANQALGNVLEWHLNTGLYIAPVVMAVGVALIVFTDPVLLQQIKNSRDRTEMQRERVKATVIAQKAMHANQKIVANLRLQAQRQMAIEARKFFKTEDVQEVLKLTAVGQLINLLRESGIELPVQTLPAPNSSTSDADTETTVSHNQKETRPTQKPISQQPARNKARQGDEPDPF